MDSPVDFGDLVEDRCQQVVEDDLTVELGHEVMDRGWCRQVLAGFGSELGISVVEDEAEQARPFAAQVEGHG